MSVRICRTVLPSPHTRRLGLRAYFSRGHLYQMRRIDELHLEYPFAGARTLRDLLLREGFAVGRKRISQLMRVMGIEALYRRPTTSRRHPEHTIYPYRLRGLDISRPNPLWAMDITISPWPVASSI